MVRYGQECPDQVPNGGVDVEEHLLDLITHQGYTDDDASLHFLPNVVYMKITQFVRKLKTFHNKS